jgi:predicted enzyme related to lactoylglutathione lyase
MPVITKHAPGAFCWAEVGTVNAARTKAFYSELFGWTYQDKAGDFGTYSIVRKDGHDLGGLYELPPNLRQMGVPPHWMSYIAVADANAAVEKIKKQGGVVQQGPFDVMDQGRMAICQDPTGATFSIWQPLKNSGATLMGENGTPCWFELATKGVAQAEAFYKSVFGWSVKHSTDAGMVYHELTAAGAPMPQGGMMELTPQHGPTPPHWLIYFAVDDCDGDATRAKALGGNVIVPPMDIPKVGRFSVLADPAGAAFAIFKLALDPSHKHEAAAPAAAKPAAKAAKKKGK